MQDSLDGALRDPDGSGDIPDTGVRGAGQVNEHVRMVGQERPL